MREGEVNAESGGRETTATDREARRDDRAELISKWQRQEKRKGLRALPLCQLTVELQG